MRDTWWITRPKRKLNTIPEALIAFSGVALNEEWYGQLGSHLALEKALEDAGIKRIGDRRDQTGGGARTYYSWLQSLGLVFRQTGTEKIKLTLAGEAIVNGTASPVAILTNQILKFQYPSPYSVARGVDLSPRFKIRPFRFLFRLLLDSRIGYLTEEEIAYIVMIHAEKETDIIYESVINRILDYRATGNANLPIDAEERYGTLSNLRDCANTMVNWLEYTQFIGREKASRTEKAKAYVLDSRKEELSNRLEEHSPFIDRPAEEERFQRKYGLDLEHDKDTRNLTGSSNISARIIIENQIQRAYISYTLLHPVAKIDATVIAAVSDASGLDLRTVEDVLKDKYPNGSIGAFMTNYFEMAFRGRDEATDFEKATQQLFQDVFGYTAKHIGPIGLTPDVLLVSDDDGYQAILDNKAYHHYSINNDHRNRMIHNYIEGITHYSSSHYPLAFFSYIAGGFGNMIDSQIQSISTETGVKGSAIDVSNMIKMVEKQAQAPYNHSKIREIFSLNRRINITDI